MLRKLKCNNELCDGTFSHLLGDKSMHIVRQKQEFIINGPNWMITGTCGKCGKKSTFFVENGKFDESDVTFKEPISVATPVDPIATPVTQG